MFTGREWLSTLGLYDYRNRYYQPQTRALSSTRSTGFAAGDANLFRYCGGDPVNYSDPTGETPVYHAGGNNFTYILNLAYNPTAWRLRARCIVGSMHCASGAQYLAGPMPKVEFWRQGGSITKSTSSGNCNSQRVAGGALPE